jgi:unsaturated rhamnogalacturonyl hydrolase
MGSTQQMAVWVGLAAVVAACGADGRGRTTKPLRASGGDAGISGGAGSGTAVAGGSGAGAGSGGAAERGGAGGSTGAHAGGSAVGGTSGQGGSTGVAGTGAGAGNTGPTGGEAGEGALGAAGAEGTTRMLAEDSLAVRFANAIMARDPDPLDITSGATFEYNHGIVLRGIEQVYRYTHDKKYLDYVQSYVDDFVSADGAITIASGYSLDNIEPAVLLPFLYAETGLAKYKTAADNVRALYDGFPRNADDGFWHKQTYPNQMWLDGIYMGEPFLAEYGSVVGTCGSFCADTVVEQTSLLAAHVEDSTSGLLKHAWDDSASGSKATWADPTTGVSPEVWGRALGWYAMSLVDTLPLIPDSTTGKSELVTILGRVAAGIKQYQDSQTGLWFQVVDKGSLSDDWLETSGSGMFVYALSAGVTRGLLDASYADVAAKGFAGLQTKVTFAGDVPASRAPSKVWTSRTTTRATSISCRR